VNDPQIWTLIGVFAAIMLGGMTAMTTLITRATTSSIDGLRGEIGARFDGMRGEFNARFDSIEKQVSLLDRDVAALTRKVWGDTPES